MFSGIVEGTASVTAIEKDRENIHFTLHWSKADELKVDQSLSHNGVCLTVVNSKDNSFQVAIIPYTYEVTNFHTFMVGTVVNLEFDIIGKYLSRLMKYQ
jgi:riboflavin synthase